MTDTGEAVDRQAPERPPDMRPVKLRVSLFFDGTGNNRTNTNHRERNTWTYAIMSRLPTPTGSYENHFSNVSLLEENVADSAEGGYELYLHIYVSGIGTQESESDDIPGLSGGYGFRGITTKVENAIGLAAYRLTVQYARGTAPVYLELITVDTCGFSRGAAAARHCVHRVLHDPQIGMKRRLEAVGWRVGTVEVRAVGLFDTVSSYVPHVFNTDFSNDTAELQLDAIREAKAVYQLAAGEEYRQNFALTNIDSASGHGRQVYMPGAHSDVGGGYLEGAREKQTLTTGRTRSVAVVEFLGPRGWYRTLGPSPELRHIPEYDAVAPGPMGPMAVHTDARVEVDRPSISRRYTLIPLRLMAEFLRDEAVPVRPTLEAANDPGDVPGREAIEDYARGIGNVTDSQPSRWEGTSAVLRQLRHGFLHVSFSNGIGMGVRIEAGRPSREVHDG